MKKRAALLRTSTALGFESKLSGLCNPDTDRLPPSFYETLRKSNSKREPMWWRWCEILPKGNVASAAKQGKAEVYERF